MIDRPLVVFAFFAATAIACTKPEAGAGSSTDSGAAAATASGTVAVAPPASVSAATAKNAEPTPATSGSAVVVGDAGPATCGTKPLPDCPLQAWMKSNANPPVTSGDLPALAIALEKVVLFAPAGYTNWASVAKDGAAAAKSGDLTAAKAACRTCHEQYKQKYKTEMRGRKI